MATVQGAGVAMAVSGKPVLPSFQVSVGQCGSVLVSVGQCGCVGQCRSVWVSVGQGGVLF